MNIIFLSISYSENDHISFYEELLQEFVQNGHYVYVACASEKRKGRETNCSIERNIHVLRIKTGNITGNMNIFEKGMSTLSIDKMFQRAINKYYSNIKFDLIIYPTPPITLVGTVEMLKKRCDATTYLLLKDIFPQNAVDLNMLSKTGIKGFIYSVFRAKEKRLYKVSDYIGCMSPANVKYVLEHNEYVDEKKIEVCPNCVKPLIVIKDKAALIQIRQKYSIPIDKKVFVYGGNLGKPQGIKFFLECLNGCKEINEAFFLVVGGGSEAPQIKAYLEKHKIQNAKLLDTLPKEDYELLVNACDVGLIFLDYRFTIPNFPSRILSYLQTAKPVIVSSDPVTDMGDIAENNQFGWKCLSNDVNGFVNCVNKALSEELSVMGNRGRMFLEENYSVQRGYDIIMSHFKEE